MTKVKTKSKAVKNALKNMKHITKFIENLGWQPTIIDANIPADEDDVRIQREVQMLRGQRQDPWIHNGVRMQIIRRSRGCGDGRRAWRPCDLNSTIDVLYDNRRTVRRTTDGMG